MSSPVRTRVWLAVVGLLSVTLLFGGITLFAWTIDETHFDRPDAGFDRLATAVEAVPGVNVDQTERWVEAPTFLRATSWISLTVDQENLPQLLDTACATGYTDDLTWSLQVATGSGDVVSLHADSLAAERSEGTRCVDLPFDAVALVGAVDRLHPGVDLQATMWEGEQFALTALDVDGGTLSALLPLVAQADDLRDAAGLAPSRSVQIDSANLGLTVGPGEHSTYSAMLTVLAEQHGVTSYWADGGGTPIDGVEKVQVVAPEEEHAAIEDIIRTSGLHVAGLPVRFIPSSG